jgi:hypothetical protein
MFLPNETKLVIFVMSFCSGSKQTRRISRIAPEIPIHLLLSNVGRELPCNVTHSRRTKHSVKPKPSPSSVQARGPITRKFLNLGCANQLIVKSLTNEFMANVHKSVNLITLTNIGLRKI